jgi:hypothetical protein
MIKLSIVILSYNTRDLTLECLKSIVSQYEKELEKNELEVIVVDNNSSDDSIKSIKSYLSDLNFGKAIFLISSNENLGFGKGNNLGAKAAKGKSLLFLNSDTEVLNKGFLTMADFLEKNSRVGILGGKLENIDGTAQKSCGRFYNLYNLLLMLLGFERFGFLRSSPENIQKVDWVSGACLMIKSAVFEKISRFDEKIFMYAEDMEICYRAKKFGFLTYFYPNLSLKHKSLGSSNKTFAIINIYKGILYFYKKHKTYSEYLIAKTLLILKAKILIFLSFIIFNPKLRETYRKAIA